jgi:hypothetical protein
MNNQNHAIDTSPISPHEGVASETPVRLDVMFTRTVLPQKLHNVGLFCFYSLSI